MKGILLAGGTGSRLHPLTKVVSKHLLPVYDKPMVYYPLSTLMLCGIREILLISSREHLPQYRALLGDGGDLGLAIDYMEQPEPVGIPQAFEIGASFIGDDSVALILGDNIFFAQGLSGLLQDAARKHQGATIFGHGVHGAGHYGVARFDEDGQLEDIDEKPSEPGSNVAITGLYFYDADVVVRARSLRPSKRGETEITELNRRFLADGRLRLVQLGRGAAWFDAGRHQELLEASNFIATIQHRQGFKVACLEEVAYRMGYIDAAALQRLAGQTPDPDYRQYLEEIAAVDRPHTVTADFSD